MRKASILVTCIVVILCIPLLLTNGYVEDASITQDVGTVASQILHDPVYITSDAQFASAGFEGDGTPANPYRIYSLFIPSDGMYGIWISNTNAYFEIWDCLLNGSTSKGIAIWNCNDANITDTIVSGAETSISIGATDVAWIENCNLTPTAEGIGLDFDDVASAWISDCTITGGLMSSSIISTAATFTENSFADSNNGIVCEPAVACTFSSNTFDNCGGYGIKLEEGSLSCTIDNNNFTGFFTGGILLRNTRSMSIMANNFTRCGLTVIGSSFANYDHIVSGNLVNSKPLLYLQDTEGGYYSGDDYGQIYLVSCTDVTIHGGIIASTQRGVFFAYSSECTVEEILITACQVGVDIDNSENITVQNCIIRRCNTGVLLFSGANYNSFLNNTINYSIDSGVLINPSAIHNLLVNNSFYYNDDGLIDNGYANSWDDDIQFGNFYDDYNGTGVCPIPGTAESVDHYPRRYVSVGTGGSILPPLSPIVIIALGVTVGGVAIVLFLLKRVWSSKSI